MKNLVVLGPQGSGKGTQAELLAEKLNFVVIEAGGSLREIAKTDTELGRRVKARIDKGFMVEPEEIAEVIRAKLVALPSDQGVILESYPRSLEQYETMKKFWPELGRGDFKVIYVDIPEEESIKRLSSRRVCEKCGRNYIAGTVQKCSMCGGELVQRQDDYPEAVKERLAWSNSELMPLVEELEKEGKVIRIDGRPSIEEVHREIIEKLNI
ncbi:hypothetical protein A2116_02570 [Candidatus Jorgensenbacteria bacterium GWA1_49_17]|uniref:Adenylate kinase n=2 Tax=Candidatus Joergenseniibacteriota TaxID=1752739 RepID=A0A1F6BQ15_9BACT|nr:MAG: Adenylate kinase [Microgenomates group bacterium GW2011_GWB1_45_17]OGG39015.1 MAG: hypothetical protein A2127_01570 [Candidatus Jorgensenbacteria bacterium GWC1_48_12]OGG39990.1 MAG: hypothetical protein A2116_02570 [Candidatus Jorgensenbacteria bacterium GWA1_49_17]